MKARLTFAIIYRFLTLKLTALITEGKLKLRLYTLWFLFCKYFSNPGTVERKQDGRLKSVWTDLITPFTHSTYRWSFVRSSSLAKGGTSKKRPSSHLHKVPTRSNKMSPRTFQTALVVAPPS
jgi:hypothetical protein